MSSYISRVFSRPSVVPQATPPPSQDREAGHEREVEIDDLNHIENDNEDTAALRYETRTPPSASQKQPRASNSQRRQNIDSPAVDDQNAQFTVMSISTLLAQNSNLLAQNLEMSRENERLRAASLQNMEEFKKGLKEEVQVMVRDAIKELVDTLGQLRPTPRPTPPSTGSGTGLGATTSQIGLRMDRQDFGDLIHDHQENEEERPVRTESRKDKGKERVVDETGGGVDPNDLRILPPRATFLALDASPSVGPDDARREYSEDNGWGYQPQGGLGGASYSQDTAGTQRGRQSQSYVHHSGHAVN
jgi:hypothetical protein